MNCEWRYDTKTEEGRLRTEESIKGERLKRKQEKKTVVVLKWLRNNKKKTHKEAGGGRMVKKKGREGEDGGGHHLGLIPYLPACIRFPVRDRLTDRMRSA